MPGCKETDGRILQGILLWTKRGSVKTGAGGLQILLAERYRFRIIRDIGSGINYRKKGLTELIGLVYSGEAERIVVNYKDRLVRVGYEMLEEVCRLNEVEIEIINSTSEDSDEEELVKDVLSIITVFSSRLYGRRSHKNKDIIKENRRLFQIEESKEAGKEAEEETHL